MKTRLLALAASLIIIASLALPLAGAAQPAAGLHIVFLPNITKPDQDSVQPGGTIVFSEDFEGAFPGTWIVVDRDKATNGEYYWAKRNCRAFSGSYSGWAVGGGANGSSLACGSDYPNNAHSVMINGPFSLEGATAGNFKLKLLLNSEENDYFFLGASVDGQEFYGNYVAGYSDGWVTMSLDLTKIYELGNIVGKPRVWIAVGFESDGANTLAAGAYVDDIVLSKYTPSSTTSAPTAQSVTIEPNVGNVVIKPTKLTIER